MRHPTLSKKRINRLRVQGFVNQNETELSAMAFGIRFAYRVCTSLLIVAIATQSIALFTVVFGIAFGGATLRNHPFDYVYNNLLSQKMGTPKLPPRARQLRFACTIATLWLGGIIYCLSTGATTTANALAFLFVFIAGLLSTTDICIPSIIYNRIAKGSPQLIHKH